MHVILDNLNMHRDTHQGNFVSQWNRRHGGRFRFHYTPTHGSWLNQIELWFAIVSRRVLKYGNFPSPDALVKAIEGFIDEWNQAEARPFRWTYEGLPLVRLNPMAKSQRQQLAQRRLTTLLEQSAITEGMYVRSHGDHLILGRMEQFGPDREPEACDRVRLTDLGRAGYGLSVKRHTGRWEKTPFTGPM